MFGTILTIVHLIPSSSLPASAQTLTTRDLPVGLELLRLFCSTFPLQSPHGLDLQIPKLLLLSVKTLITLMRVSDHFIVRAVPIKVWLGQGFSSVA